MEYKIFDVSLICGKRFSLTADFKPKEGYDRDVADDYGQHDNFGFYGSDLKNAFSHAALVIDQMFDRTGDDRQEDAQRLVDDVDNYLSCRYTWEAENAGETQFLLKAMMYFELHSELYALIMKYYREFDEERREDDEKGPFHWALDFQELYIQYGDQLLMEEGKPAWALKYYELAALDWSAGDEEKQRTDYGWYMKYREYRWLFEGTLRQPGHKAENDRDRQLQRYYCRILDIFGRKQEESSALEAMNRFFEEYQEVMEREEDNYLRCELMRAKQDIHVRRRSLFMAYAVRERGLLLSLGSLEHEATEDIQEYWKNAVECIRKSENEDLEVIRQYVYAVSSRILKTYSVFLRALKMARMILRVEDVKRCLLAGKGKNNIAYYTSLQTLQYLLPGPDREDAGVGKLSVMHVAYMNDPTEGKMLKRYLIPGTKDFDDTDSGRKNAAYPYVFMKCFTPLIDDLPMWEMYGDHAEGCCIILKNGEFLKDGGRTVQVPLYHICYLRKQKNTISITAEDNPQISDVAELEQQMEDIRNILRDDIKNRDWYIRIIEDIVYLFKDADYHHEREMRIVYQYHKYDKEMRHTPGEYPKLFIRPDFYPNIKEIILGPKFEDRADKMPYIQEQIQKLCEKNGMPEPLITLSSIEYR